MLKKNGAKQLIEDRHVVPSTAHKPIEQASLFTFAENEAVIKMTTTGQSFTMRYVSRTQRVDLDWLFDRINEDSGIQRKYVYTNDWIADILDKGVFLM